jgi:aspartyl protease family protein
MAGGNGIVWVGAGLIGLAFLAPNFSTQKPEVPAPREAKRPSVAPRLQAGNGFASRDITRAPDGHFYVDAQVNGAQIHFLVDTGASMVALTSADAQRAGIALPSERNSAETAGGTVEVIPVSIDRLAIGPIEARDVRGAVADALPISLLGQSFLSQVATVEISGDRMTLR